MNLFIAFYLVVAYASALAFMIMSFQKEGELTIADIIMLVLAPFSMVPIIVVQMLSTVFDLDTPIIKK